MTEETQQTFATQNYQQLKSKNEKLKSKKEQLEDKKKELEETLRTTNEEYYKMTEEFMKISKDIEKRNEELQEKFLNENIVDSKGKANSLINREEIQIMCKKTLDEFLVSTEDNLNSLKIEIIFGKTTLYINLENENITFGRLKESVMSNLDREIHEFYFTDKNSAIYMDEMNVKKALFPLDKVNVVGVMPKLFVKDDFKEIDFNEIKLENLDKNNNEGLNSRRKVTLNHYQSFKRNFLSNWIIYSKIILNTIFIIVYILSMHDFRDIFNNRIIMETYSKNFFTVAPSIDSNLLYNFKNEFIRVFQYPLEKQDQNYDYDYSKMSCKNI
jgi:hypothetical protein